MSDDEDEDDLWGDIDEPDNNLMVSANLSAVVGVEEKKVHAGEPDEGQIRWVAPSFSGLSNSDTVDVKGGHWYKEGDSPMTKAAPSLVPNAATPGVTPAAQPSSTPWTPAFALPQGADGRIDWGAMMANSAK